MKFFFDIYPYISACIFTVVCLIRYDYAQYSWQARSSQFLCKNINVYSNVFHIGVIGILFCHIVGLLVPHSFYVHFISAGKKQFFAIIIGSLLGNMVLYGGCGLLLRRITNVRIRRTSSFMDILILLLIVMQAFLGLFTIPFSILNLDGSEMLKCSNWAQAVVYFKQSPSKYLVDINYVSKIHIILGITLVFLFPFTRLIHSLSFPIYYLYRHYQIVQTKKENKN